MTNQIEVKEIKITRAEGPSDLCGSITVNTWTQAELIIKMNAANAPDDGSYDKTDFTIVYENGDEYDGRIDVKYEMMKEDDNLEQHIKHELEFYSSERAYATLVSRIGEEQAKQRANDCLEILRNYKIGE